MGETFDIHGGGKDLIFPHHENEIAQSEGAFGRPFARYWIHNGFVNINQEKMSKSLGNFLMIRDVIRDPTIPKRCGCFCCPTTTAAPSILRDRRWTRRRSGLDKSIRAAGARWKTMDRDAVDRSDPPGAPAPWEHFSEAMDDDFNTAHGHRCSVRWRCAN